MRVSLSRISDYNAESSNLIKQKHIQNQIRFFLKNQSFYEKKLITIPTGGNNLSLERGVVNNLFYRLAFPKSPLPTNNQ
jgi:hypothetical protein